MLNTIQCLLFDSASLTFEETAVNNEIVFFFCATRKGYTINPVSVY